MSDHLAIMKADWGLLPKILSGEKKIESRWGINRPPYWGKVHIGDVVYFKDSGQPVTVKATVGKLELLHVNGYSEVLSVLLAYGKDDGLTAKQIPDFANLFAKKRFAMLVYLADAHRIEPFAIDKTGYGNQVAWITVDSIEQLKQGREAIPSQGVLAAEAAETKEQAP